MNGEILYGSVSTLKNKPDSGLPVDPVVKIH